MKIEEAMIDGLDGNVEGRAVDLSFGLREPGHGSYRHQSFLIAIA
jgi:hypothetical protein